MDIKFFTFNQWELVRILVNNRSKMGEALVQCRNSLNSQVKRDTLQFDDYLRLWLSATKMKTKGLDLPNVIGLLLLGLIVLVVVPELVLPRGINPVVLTRHAIEQCYKVETAVGNARISGDLKFFFGAAVKQSVGFKQGNVKVSEGDKPVVLDAWQRPLQIVAKTNLMALRDVSRALLANTNDVIIWSSGPNGINEFGNGDDVFLSAPGADK